MCPTIKGRIYTTAPTAVFRQKQDCVCKASSRDLSKTNLEDFETDNIWDSDG